MHALGSVLSTWVRWLLLSSLLFAAIGFAEPGSDAPSDGIPPLGEFPRGGLPYEMPPKEYLDPHDVLLNIDPNVLKSLTPAQRAELPKAIVKQIIENRLFTYKTSGVIQPQTRFEGKADKLEVQFAPLDKDAELEASRDRFEAEHPGGRWTPEMWDSFRATSEISYPSNYDGVDNVFQIYKINLLFFSATLHKGMKNIAIDFKKNVRTGVYELLVMVPDSLVAKEGLSVREATVGFIKDVGGIFSQLTGRIKSVPAFSADQAATMVAQLADAEIVNQELEKAALSAFKGGGDELNAYRAALTIATDEWEEHGEKAAARATSDQVSSMNDNRRMDPATREYVTKLVMGVKKAKFLAEQLLRSKELMAVGRENSADLRLMDEDLMEKVQEYLQKLEAMHSKMWGQIASTVSSQTYSQLIPQYQGDAIGLAQATVDEVQRLKQDHFYNLILKDSGLDTCHPRAAGIGKLVVEHGKALQLVYSEERAFAQGMQNRRAEYEARVHSEHLLKGFSSQYREEKADELMTEEYQALRPKLYKEIVGKIREAGYANTATMLASTLQELETVSKIRRDVMDAEIPAVALSWDMPALSEGEWTKVSKDGKWYGSPGFQKWVTSNQSFYRVRAFAASTVQAFRILQRKVLLEQFWRGPAGLKATFGVKPFPFQDKVDSETGDVVPDVTTTDANGHEVVDPNKYRATWVSNMGSILEWGKRTWNQPRWKAIPRPLWNLYIVPKAVLGTAAGMIGWTAVRAVGFAGTAAVTATTTPQGAVVGGLAAGAASNYLGYPVNVSAMAAAAPLAVSSVWAPLSGLIATGFSHFVYDQYRAKGTAAEEALNKEKLANRSKWLTIGGTLTGLGYSGYLDYSNFLNFAGSLGTQWMEATGYIGALKATGLTALEPLAQLSTWQHLISNQGFHGLEGFAGGFALGMLAMAQSKGYLTLPSKILSAIPYSIERLSAAVASVPLRATNAARYLLGGAGKAAVEHVRDFVWRDAILGFFLDTVFPVFGTSGVTVRDSLHMHQVQGPGVASQHYYGMSRPLALASLWGTLESIDLNNWAARREAESKEPRAAYQASTGVEQVLVSGDASNASSPFAKVYDKFEKADEKFRTDLIAERRKMIEPLLAAGTALSGKIRFSDSELALLRAEAAELAKRFFTEMAHADTTPDQKKALWQDNGVQDGDWSGLADKLLVTTFGTGVLQSFEGLDMATRAEVHSATADQIVGQMLDGRDLNTSGTTILHAVPDSVATATAYTPFLGASDICSKQVIRATPQKPWMVAREQRLAAEKVAASH